MAKCSFIRATEARDLARNITLIWSEICGVQEAILAAIDNGEYEVIVSDGTPFTQVNEVQSVTVTNGGTNYQPVVATASIVHPNGSGASVTPVVTGGQITGFTINNAGTNYGPIPATINMTGSGNGDAQLQPVVVNGSITNVNILDSGTGYTVGNPVPAVRPPGNTGTNFAATVSLVGGSGEILAVNITNQGTGYETVVAEVSITHPTGTGFEGVVQTSGGAITGISIQDGGVAYGPLLPTATVVDSSGTGAVLSITESDIAAGVIQNINVVEGGFGYSQSATVTITAAQTSSGSGATATVTVDPDPNGYGTTSPQYYSVLSGQTTDRVITDQIEYVQDYFDTLGYNIRAQVNPNTGNTMQWYVIW